MNETHARKNSTPDYYKSMVIQSRLSISLTLRLIFTGKNPNFILLNSCEPIQKTLQFAHWINQLFAFCDEAEF